MKKLLLFLPVLFILSTTEYAPAQSVSAGIRGGISIPNLTTNSDNPVSEGYSSRFGGDAAVFANIRFSKLFSLQPMIEFSQQGGKRNGRQAFPAPEDYKPILEQITGEEKDFMYVNIKSKAKLNYLMFPILARFGWNLGHSREPRFRFYADAGPFVGYLISAHQELNDTETKIYGSKDAEDDILGGQTIDIGQFTDTNRDIRSDIKHWNVGISGNLGFSYNFARSSIFVEGGGNYGFIQIQEDTKNGTNRTGAATVDLGYSFQL